MQVKKARPSPKKIRTKKIEMTPPAQALPAGLLGWYWVDMCYMSHISSSCFGVNSNILPPKKAVAISQAFLVTPPFFSPIRPHLNPTCCCGLTRIRHHLGSLKPSKMLRHLSYQLVQDFSPSTCFNHFELSYARATERVGFKTRHRGSQPRKRRPLGPSAWRFPTKTKSLKPSFFLFRYSKTLLFLGPCIHGVGSLHRNMYLDIYHHKSMDQYIFWYFSNILSFKPTFFHIALSFPVPFHVWSNQNPWPITHPNWQQSWNITNPNNACIIRGNPWKLP